MKKVVSMFLICLGFLVACNATGSESAETNGDSVKLKVYYFHNAHRCMTCNAIEKNTKETLETYFKKEVEAGEIQMVVLNAEEKQNRDLVNKYEIWGSSLVLVKFVDGKEDVESLTEFAFANARQNSEKFKSGLKEKIKEKLQ
ncbi:MAG: thioredoxin [Bacteroidales bacterium]|nr:thioredoxin [Bacteroidales bacterium]